VAESGILTDWGLGRRFSSDRSKTEIPIFLSFSLIDRRYRAKESAIGVTPAAMPVDSALAEREL